MKHFKNIKDKILMKIESIPKEDIIIFLIPFLMFLIYWIVFYPGILSYDSHYQINEILSSKFDTAHPFFHTFIEMVLMKLWNTPAVVGLFQIFIFSILWTKICKYNRKKNNKLAFYSQMILTFIIALNPLNSLMSITLWKDVLYSYGVLWLCFELQKIVDKKFKIGLPDILKTSFLLMALPNIRHNGYIITLVISIVLIVLLLIRDKKSKNFLKFSIFLIIFFFCFKALERMYVVEERLNIKDTAEVIDYKLLSLVGEIGRKGRINNQEIIEINKYAEFNKLVIYTHYNLTDVIWIYCELNSEALQANQKDFYKLMINLISKNKLLTIKYFMKDTAFVWRIVRLKDSWGIMNYYGISASNAINIYIRPFSGTQTYIAFIKYVIFSRENIILQTLFYSGSLHLYISLAVFIYLKIKHKINSLLIFLPILVNLLGLILTMPVNDVRYYYSSFLVCYLMVAIFIKYYAKGKYGKK